MCGSPPFRSRARATVGSPCSTPAERGPGVSGLARQVALAPQTTRGSRQTEACGQRARPVDRVRDPLRMPRSRFSRELSGCRWPRPAGELVGDGISKDVLGGPRWRRTSHGFYVPSSSDDRAGLPSQRILDATPLVPPTGAMTGWAAAFIDGVDQLDGLDAHTMRPLPVPITLGRDVGRRRTDIATYTRERLADHDVDVRVRDPGGKPRPRHVRWRPLRRGSRRGCCLRGRLCSRREGEAAELAQVRRRPSRLDGHRPGPHSRWPRRGRNAERLGVAAASLLRRRRRTSPTSSQHPGLRRWRQTARHRRPARRRCRPCRRVRRSAPPAAFAAPRGQRAGGGIRVRRTHRRTSRQSRPPGLSTGAGTTSP